MGTDEETLRFRPPGASEIDDNINIFQLQTNDMRVDDNGLTTYTLTCREKIFFSNPPERSQTGKACKR